MYSRIAIDLKISGGLLMTEMLWPDPSDSCKCAEVIPLSMQSAGEKSGVNGAESGLLLPTTMWVKQELQEEENTFFQQNVSFQ